MTADAIATELYDEIQDTTSISVSGISYWLRSNVGKLNNLIYTSFNAPSSGAGYFYYSSLTSDDMTDQEKDIFKVLYDIYYYDRQIRATLGAAALDPFIEISSDGATVRKINKNEMSKTFISLRKDAISELNNEVFKYTYGKSGPQQVAGDDTTSLNTTIRTQSAS